MASEEVTQRSLGGRSPAASRPSSATGSLCAFWLGERCFALETRLVGEVVTVEEYVALPLAPAAVRGVFNLRGEPVPLVETEQVLNLGSAPRALPKTPSALVLRSDDLVVGLVVSRVQGVVSLAEGQLHPVGSAQDDPGLLGFLESNSGQARTVISVLAPEHLLGRLNALRYTRVATAS